MSIQNIPTYLLITVSILLMACGSKKEMAETEEQESFIDVDNEEKVFLDKMLNNDIVHNEDPDKIRKVSRRNTKGVYTALEGKQEGSQIVAHVFIRRDGSIMHAMIDESMTTTEMDQGEKNNVIKALSKYKYKADKKAPLLQRGKVTFKF